MNAYQPTLHSPKRGSEISVFGRTLFVFPWATDLFFDSLSSVGHSNMESIILQVSAPGQRQSTLSKIPLLSLHSCLPGQGVMQHIITPSHFSEFNKSLRLHILSCKMDMRFHPESQAAESPPPPSSWGASAQMLAEEARFQFMWDILWRALEERSRACMKHEKQQFIVSIAKTWNHKW